MVEIEGQNCSKLTRLYIVSKQMEMKQIIVKKTIDPS
jgi:hypothetical protein